MQPAPAAPRPCRAPHGATRARAVPLAQPVLGSARRSCVARGAALGPALARPASSPVRARLRRAPRRPARQRGVERDRRPAPRAARGRRGGGRRGRHVPVLVRRLGQRDPLRARQAGLRRHRPASRSTSTPHAAAAAVTERTTALLPVHIFGWPADVAGPGARSACPSSRTPARRSARVHADGDAGRRARPPGRVRLLRQQAADHGRGRHGRDGRRRRSKERDRLRAQPGPRARHGLARPRPARLQLPPVRPAVRARRSPSSSGSTTCSPAARASPASTREALAGVEGLELPVPRQRRHRRRGWFVYVVQLPHGLDRDEVDPRAARAGRRLQALPAGDPPVRFYRERFGHREGQFPVVRGRRRALAGAAVLPADDRGPGRARRRVTRRRPRAP